MMILRIKIMILRIRNKMSESLEQRLASLEAAVSELKDREAIREVITR